MTTLHRLRARAAAVLAAAATAVLLAVAPAGAPPAGASGAVPGTLLSPPTGAPAAPSAPTRHSPRCPSGHVALTFDDGPSPSITPRLVRLLREQHVPATFFVVGSRVRGYPEVARLIARHGFTLANHTDDHRDLTTLSRREIRAEVTATWRALHDAGVEHVSRYVRPPYGATGPKVERVLDALGAVPVLWTVDSRDWDGLTARQIRRTTLAQVRDRGTAGSVVLHHDGVANSEATLAALPSEIARLRRAGYCFTGLGRAGVLS